MTFLFLFFKGFIYFLEKRGRKRGKETSSVVASHAPPTGDLACNPGMCPRLGNPLVCRPTLNPLSHTSQGINNFFFLFFNFLLLFEYICLQFPPPPTIDPTTFWLCPWILYICSLTTIPLLSPTIPHHFPLWLLLVYSF